jgi:hypothetical protein
LSNDPWKAFRGYIVRLFFTGRLTHRCINPDLSSDPQFAESNVVSLTRAAFGLIALDKKVGHGQRGN